MQQLSTWMGAGLITAGVSAAMLTGAGAAAADTESDGPKDAKPSSESSESTNSSAPSKPSTPSQSTPDADEKAADADAEDVPGAGASQDDEPEVAKKHAKPKSAAAKKRSTAAATDEPSKTDESSSTESTAAESPSPPEPSAATEIASVEEVSEATTPTPAPAPAPAPHRIVARAEVTSPSLTAATPPAPLAGTLLGVVTGVIGGVVSTVGSIAITAVQTAEAIVTGPPKVPPGSTVTVRSAPLALGTGQRVDANWYFPETTDGAPPQRMILLQHGFLALGPMYSYTAATLAERTGSVVVTPSLPSNPFLGDDRWLGGTGMGEQIADLFDGDRAALTESAVHAGYATQYDFGADAVALPKKFALAGHSLGGNLVSAAAGFLVDNGAVDDLVGVILLDGVPFESTLPDAITKLDAYEAATDRYVPIRAIGAPPNPYNFISNVNEVLSTQRAGHFNGVVLVGGVHMDSMRGGNPLIQFAAYVAAGFPQPQNPPAVDELAVAWLDEWFTGAPEPAYVPGSTIPIATPAGQAQGVVIGAPPYVLRQVPQVASTLVPTTPTTLPAAAPLLVAPDRGRANLGDPSLTI